MGVGGSYHKIYGWKGQYERSKRWQKRIQKIKNSTRSPKNKETDFDFIYAFFQNCLHLRDWLYNTNTIPEKEIRKFFASHRELQICRDICVGLKHYKINKPDVDNDPSIVWEYSETPIKPFGKAVCVILAGGDKYDLFELADKCMALWGSFLRKKKLI